MTSPLGDETPLHVVEVGEPYESFFLREFPRMVAVAYAISGSRWAAEELAQEALLRAYRSWDKISSYDKPGAWLRRVTINLANSFLRRRTSELKAVGRYAMRVGEPIAAHEPEDERFWAQVKQLPRRQREAVVLHYVDDLKTADIANVLDIAESSVRTHLQRGLQTLSQRIDFEVTT